jgi:DNA repair exonuclease SbcCD nuclease subunit
MGEESVIRFLIASDVHAGYGENKPFIGNDTFDTLREVLTKASETKVDFILMGALIICGT